MEKPKILVSSVDAWSDYVGSDTLSSLLSQFESKDVAAINIRARKSDSKVAGRYFHILEGRIIKSMFSTSSPTYPASVSVVASAIANGTFKILARV